MKRRWILAVAALPLPVLVLIPGGLLILFRNTRWTHAPRTSSDPLFLLGVAIGAVGIASAAWSVSVFRRYGEGTPAPWDPPINFTPDGPYRFVRNPMILGVLFVLLAESLLLRSQPLFAWFLVFLLGNAFYIPLVEEKGLERRFGTAYSKYKDGVPRWFPRMNAWNPTDNATTKKSDETTIKKP